MFQMATCKHRKRLQIYLDGWMERVEAVRFEKHLKKCSECQSELMALEEVSSSALEIVDEAPESSYWDSFYARTLNRIISRDVTPYEQPEESRKSLRLKIGTYSLAIISLAAVLLLALNFIPGILNSTSDQQAAEKSPTPRTEVANIESDNEVTTGSAQVEPVTLKSPQNGPALQIPANPQNQAGEPSEKALTENNDVKALVNLAKNNAEIESYFKGNVPAESPKLELSDLGSNSRNVTDTDYEQIDDDYRLSSSMISAGILSDFDNRDEFRGAGGDQFDLSGPGDGGRDILNGSIRDWGYLSMPADSVDTLEFRRFLLELELIQTK